MPQVVSRPELAEQFKKVLSAPDPDRYPLSVSDLQWCPGKVCMKEWSAYCPPFNAKLSRGLQAEHGIRKGGKLFNVAGEVPVLTKDGIVGHPDDISPSAVVEYKSSDWTGKRSGPTKWHLEQNMAYCHMAGKTRGRFVMLYNQVNDGFGDIDIYDAEYTQDELEANWLKLRGRKEQVEDARAWAKERVADNQWTTAQIPYRFRFPREKWECKGCGLKRDGKCEGAA